MKRPSLILGSVVVLALHAVAAVALWRYWGLGSGLRAAIDAGDHLRYIARVAFIFTLFPLLVAFEYLVVRSMVTKEGFMARFLYALYGKNEN